MRFFIPQANSPEMAEQVYTGIVKFAEQNLRWQITPRRIFKIAFRHDGKDWVAEVGQVFSRTNEPVIAILESTTFLVCTPNRGVIRGEPLLVGRNEVRWIEDFESFQDEATPVGR